MKQWEYEQICIEGAGNAALPEMSYDFTGLLNEKGRDGWRLKQWKGNPYRGWIFLFEREVKQERGEIEA